MAQLCRLIGSMRSYNLSAQTIEPINPLHRDAITLRRGFSTYTPAGPANPGEAVSFTGANIAAAAAGVATGAG